MRTVQQFKIRKPLYLENTLLKILENTLLNYFVNTSNLLVPYTPVRPECHYLVDSSSDLKKLFSSQCAINPQIILYQSDFENHAE